MSEPVKRYAWEGNHGMRELPNGLTVHPTVRDKWVLADDYDRDIKALEDELRLSVFPDEDVMEVRGLRLKVAKQAATITRLERELHGYEYGST